MGPRRWPQAHARNSTASRCCGGAGATHGGRPAHARQRATAPRPGAALTLSTQRLHGARRQRVGGTSCLGDRRHSASALSQSARRRWAPVRRHARASQLARATRLTVRALRAQITACTGELQWHTRNRRGSGHPSRLSRLSRARMQTLNRAHVASSAGGMRRPPTVRAQCKVTPRVTCGIASSFPRGRGNELGGAAYTI